MTMDRAALDKKIAKRKVILDLAKSHRDKLREEVYEAERILLIAETEYKAYLAMTEHYPVGF